MSEKASGGTNQENVSDKDLDNKNVSDVSSGPEGKSSPEVDSLKKTNSDLLKETKRQKAEIERMRVAEQKRNDDKLEADGKDKELIVSLKKQNSDLAEKFKSTHLDSQIQTALVSAGCKGSFVKDLMMIHPYDAKEVFNEDFSAKEGAIDTYVSNAKSRTEELGYFTADETKVKDVNPKNNDSQMENLESLSKEEKLKLLREAPIKTMR